MRPNCLLYKAPKTENSFFFFFFIDLYFSFSDVSKLFQYIGNYTIQIYINNNKLHKRKEKKIKYNFV